MSPLAIVGQLMLLPLYLVTADVSHVIQASSNTNAKAVNSLDTAADVKPKGKGEFWWQDDDSPLQRAYNEAKNCKDGSNCVKNIQAVRINSLNSIKTDFSGNPFLSGDVTINGSSAEAKLDLSKNPFFSGHGQVIDDHGEGFLGVQPAEIRFHQSKPLSLTHPLSTADCSANGFVCVPIGKCSEDGFTEDGVARSSSVSVNVCMNY